MTRGASWHRVAAEGVGPGLLDGRRCRWTSGAIRHLARALRGAPVGGLRRRSRMVHPAAGEPAGVVGRVEATRVEPGTAGLACAVKIRLAPAAPRTLRRAIRAGEVGPSIRLAVYGAPDTDGTLEVLGVAGPVEPGAPLLDLVNDPALGGKRS